MTSPTKIPGACTICDKQIFTNNIEVMEGLRIFFALFDGSHATLSFCNECATGLTEEQYEEIWQKVLRSWMREITDYESVKGWFPGQFQNGLLFELGRAPLMGNYNG